MRHVFSFLKQLSAVTSVLTALLFASVGARADDSIYLNSSPGWVCELQMAPVETPNNEEERPELEAALITLESEIQTLQSAAVREMGQLLVDRIRFSLTGQHPALTPFPKFVRELETMNRALSEADSEMNAAPDSNRLFGLRSKHWIRTYVQTVRQTIQNAITSPIPPTYGFAVRMAYDFNYALLMVRASSQNEGIWIDAATRFNRQTWRSTASGQEGFAMWTQHFNIHHLTDVDVYTLYPSFQNLSVSDINETFVLPIAPMGLTADAPLYDGATEAQTAIDFMNHDIEHMVITMDLWRSEFIATRALYGEPARLAPGISRLQIVRASIARIRFHRALHALLPTEPNLHAAIQILLFEIHERKSRSHTVSYTATGLYRRFSYSDRDALDLRISGILNPHNFGVEFPALQAMSEGELRTLLEQGRNHLLNLLNRLQ